MNDSLAVDQDRSLLQQMPVGLVTLDAQGRITWINDFMAALLPAAPAAVIGKRADACDDACARLLSAEPALLQLPAGDTWLQRELRELADGARLLISLDVSERQALAEENARLRNQVEDLTLTDALTGLPNKRAISQALDLHISRSRRYHNPLSTVFVHVDTQGRGDVSPLHEDPLILAVARFLRDRLRWVDQVGRWEPGVFLAVLPETGIEDARGLIDKINAEQQAIALPEGYDATHPILSFGVACWQKGDDMRTLLRSTLQDLRAEAD
jgi:diguanylate cyclase (GGDEF)-like protein